MFGSQALETAIGLALLFFVTASLASAIVEGISRLLRKRARDLEQTIGMMLSGSMTFDAAAEQALDLFKGTAIYQSATVAAGRGRRWFRTDVGPAYLSARSFANGVEELSRRLGETPSEALNQRLNALRTTGQGLTLDAKAGVENWFDETMGRLGGAYKRWATGVLFLVGLLVAGLGNVSAFHAAQTLWQQPAVRQAAIDAASQNSSGDVSAAVSSIQDVAGLGMPVGWAGGIDWTAGGWVSHVGGWLVTAVLLMLGAPFWFDVLSRLTSLRATGAKPLTADKDPAAATSLRTAALTSGAPAAALGAAAGVAAIEGVGRTAHDRPPG
jgi:hypothetical protein